jgi:hypothetical protein
MKPTLSSLPNDRPPRVLAIFTALRSATWIYTIRPLGALAKSGIIQFKYVVESDVSLSDIHESDLILFSQNNQELAFDVIEEAKNYGIPTIYEVDDNCWALPLDTWIGRLIRAPQKIAMMEHYLKNVNLVKVYNPLLEDFISKNFNPNIYKAIPCIDIENIPDDTPSPGHGKIKITYITGRGPQDELFKLFDNELKNILIDYNDRVSAFFWGGIPDCFKGLPNIESVPIIYDYNEFLRKIPSFGIDIGLAPAIPNSLYLAKTNTKVRDYGAFRIAGVYSNVPLYSRDITDNETGLLVDNQPGAWYAALKKLIEDEQLLEKIKNNAYKYVFDHYRQKLAEEEWIKLIEQMVLSSTTHRPKTLQQRLGINMSAPHKEIRQGDQIWIGKTSPLPHYTVLDWDGNSELPLPTNSVEKIICDRLLESVQNLQFTIQEMFRVCKDRAQVCITASYANQSKNRVNPVYLNAINEHSARQWTAHPYSPISAFEYNEPPGTDWGIASPDSLTDLRCLRVDFVYYPEYYSLPVTERRISRHKYLNVCKVIVFQLIAIKSSIEDKDMKKLAQELTFQEPADITISRYDELLAELQKKLQQIEEESNLYIGREEQFKNALAMANQEFLQYKNTIEITNQQQEEQYKNALAMANQEVLQSKNALETNRQEISQLRSTHDVLIQKADEYERFSLHTQPSPLFSQLGKTLTELNSSPSAYQRFIDDSLLLNGNLFKYVLGLSSDLRLKPFIAYQISLKAASLEKISVAIDTQAISGSFGIEIVAPGQKIMCNQTVPLWDISPNGPVTFQFTPALQIFGGIYEIRFFTSGISPLTVFELQKPTRRPRLFSTRSKLFCSVVFST